MQSCWPRYRRVNGTVFDGVCAPCTCFGHAELCDDITGECLVSVTAGNFMDVADMNSIYLCNWTNDLWDLKYWRKKKLTINRTGLHVELLLKLRILSYQDMVTCAVKQKEFFIHIGFMFWNRIYSIRKAANISIFFHARFISPSHLSSAVYSIYSM